MNYLKQLWNTIVFTISLLRQNLQMTKLEPVIFLRNGNEESREIVLSIIARVDSDIRVSLTEDESKANVIVESKTDSFGFLFVGGKLQLFIPLRTDENEAMVNFVIKLGADLLNFTGVRHDFT